MVPHSTSRADGAVAGTYAKLLLTMFFWGGTWIAGRVVVQDVSPLAAATWRFAAATAALGVLVGRAEGGFPVPRGAQWLSLTGLGITGIFLYNLCFLYGLRFIPAGRGALIIALSPAAASLVAWAFFRDRMTPVRAIGIGVALSGCVLVIGRGDPRRLLHGHVGPGEVLILACVLFWTAYTFIGKTATRTLSPLVATFYGCLTGLLLLVVAGLLLSPAALVPAYPARAWAGILFLGLFGTTVGFTWFNDGVRRLGAPRATAFMNLVPVSGVLLGALLLGERLGAAELLGGVLVILGVVITNREASDGRTPGV